MLKSSMTEDQKTEALVRYAKAEQIILDFETQYNYKLKTPLKELINKLLLNGLSDPELHQFFDALKQVDYGDALHETKDVDDDNLSLETKEVDDLLTIDQVKAEFRRKGITFTQWAIDNGYSREIVYRVINGFSKANYGKSYEIAKKLGMKK